ncbi:MAG: hypothetical protein HKL89_09625 [Candidatus Dormibacteraeota bacterium]|nr:hypothetical protein [Candidatus Dormibacteraeota bacterium]
MSAATELLAELAARGARLSLREDGVLLAGPPKLVPPELARRLLAHQGELADLVARQAGVWQADPPDVLWPSQVGEDPRPDLPGSSLWAALLQLAAGDADDPQGCYGRLLGARACGAVLERRTGRWRLAPVLDPSERVSVWATRADWDADAATWLKPRSREIVLMLSRLPQGEGPKA